MKYRLDGIDIKINLQAGAYAFTPYSASGKSYLASKLRKLSTFGERCAVYTYGDKFPLNTILDASKYDIIMLERYDMYYGDCFDLIEMCSKNSIILIDSKKEIPESIAGLCSIILLNGEIYVC